MKTFAVLALLAAGAGNQDGIQQQDQSRALRPYSDQHMPQTSLLRDVCTQVGVSDSGQLYSYKSTGEQWCIGLEKFLEHRVQEPCQHRWSYDQETIERTLTDHHIVARAVHELLPEAAPATKWAEHRRMIDVADQITAQRIRQNETDCKRRLFAPSTRQPMSIVEFLNHGHDFGVKTFKAIFIADAYPQIKKHVAKDSIFADLCVQTGKKKQQKIVCSGLELLLQRRAQRVCEGPVTPLDEYRAIAAILHAVPGLSDDRKWKEHSAIMATLEQITNQRVAQGQCISKKRVAGHSKK